MRNLGRIGRRDEFRREKKKGQSFSFSLMQKFTVLSITALECAGSIASSGFSFRDHVGRQRR